MGLTGRKGEVGAGRWRLLDRDGAAFLILRIPGALKKHASVKILAWVQFEQESVLFDHNGWKLCRWNMVPDLYEYKA